MSEQERDLVADMALCEAASTGPWVAWTGANTITSPWAGKAQIAGLPRLSADHSEAFYPADAAFIAAAREGWPWCIRELAEARMEIQRLRYTLQWYAQRHGYNAIDRCPNYARHALAEHQEK